MLLRKAAKAKKKKKNGRGRYRNRHREAGNREQTACSVGLVRIRPSDARGESAGIGIGIGFAIAIAIAIAIEFAIEFARPIEEPFTRTKHASQLNPSGTGPGWGLDRGSGREIFVEVRTDHASGCPTNVQDRGWVPETLPCARSTPVNSAPLVRGRVGVWIAGQGERFSFRFADRGHGSHQRYLLGPDLRKAAILGWPGTGHPRMAAGPGRKDPS